jgi:RND family efflux transporter MFP subunit
VAAVPVETAIAEQTTISGLHPLTGTIEPVETVTVTSRVMGQIKSLPVEEGDRVRVGQVLATIDVKDIQAQQERASAAIAQAQAGVTVAQAAANQAMMLESQSVAQMNQAEARQRQAEAQRQEAEAELANAQLHQQRMALLRSQGVVSQSQLDEANTQVASLQARIAQAAASIEQAKRGIEQSQAAVAQSKAGVAQAKAGVSQALSQVEQAQAEKKQAIANLDYGTVTAPFDGVVTKKQAEVGAMAGAGQPLVTIESRKRLRFSAEVPESLIALVRQGDGVTIHLDAGDRLLKGRVQQIIPSADPNSRSFTIKIALEDTAHLMSGLYGRLELPQDKREALLMPASALIRRGQLEGVYVVGKDNTAQLRWIKTGKVRGDQIEITAGLSLGDRIITSNLSQVSDGQVVTLK